jgi:S1-C subfamily serine protease
VVLAGAGHLVYGDGIPDRLRRRAGVEATVLLNGAPSDLEPGVADFLLLSEDRSLPSTGRLGLFLDTRSDRLAVQGFTPGSPAQGVGVEENDVIVSVNGRSIKDYADLRLALWASAPGDSVALTVERDGWLFGSSMLDFDVTLR